jgi:hypothetical protein
MSMNQASFLQGKAAELSKANPAEVPARRADTARVSMSLPYRKLEVPAIPGFVCYWFKGTPDRLARAQQAGYTFVERDEIGLAASGVANDAASDGNTDMGSRVSVSAGDNSEGLRLYLMKIPQELFDEDQRLYDAGQERVLDQLRGKGLSEPGGDNSNRYVPSGINIFQPNRKV